MMYHILFLQSLALISTVVGGLTSDPTSLHKAETGPRRDCRLQCPQGYLPGTCLCQDNLFPFIFSSTPCRFTKCPAGQICRVEGGKAVCHSHGRDTPSIDVCSLPVQPGPCKMYDQRFYFDQRDGRCKTFGYGGCQGNGNSFAAKRECENTCIVDVPVAAIGGPGGGGHPAPVVRGATSRLGRQQSSSAARPREEPSSRQAEECQLPAEPGPCRGTFPSFFFNRNSGQCESFIYGGCMGNHNRFDTAEACQVTCRGVPTPTQRFHPGSKPLSGQRRPPLSGTANGRYASADSDCNLPQASGLCLAYFPSFFYNPRTGQCESFIYGGCQGNANRFESLVECEQQCKAPATGDTGPSFPRACRMPGIVGGCRAMIPRWYFKTETLACTLFYYGGCHGNDNNFESEGECQQHCIATPGLASSVAAQPVLSSAGHAVLQPQQNRWSSSSEALYSVCSLPKETGPCRARIPAYYYDAGKAQCLIFTYGGCKGNDNRFSSYEDCQSACRRPAPGLNTGSQAVISSQPVVGSQGSQAVISSVPDVGRQCSQPRVVGFCRAAIRRFFFNATTGKCESFIYGGCNGNSNNFRSYDRCREACGGQ